MKLSEAMRLGAMMKPQAFDSLSNKGGTCAYGAAYDALGLLELAAQDKIPFPTEWGRCLPRSVVVPCVHSDLCAQTLTLRTMVTHLNDDHRWTREQIADWVEQIESRQQIEEVRHDVSEVSA